MMLIELASVPQAALPLQAFKEHLRLGTGFGDDTSQDPLLESLLRAAMAAVEAWTSKALVSRNFSWTLQCWREAQGQALPLAPVSSLVSVKITDKLGWEEAVSPTTYRLQPDTHRPLLMATGSALPRVPVGGSVEITFTAGFGPAWQDVPPDIAQAVLVLAAHYYEYRHEMQSNGGVIPYAVSALIERWRSMRLLGGRAQ